MARGTAKYEISAVDRTKTVLNRVKKNFRGLSRSLKQSGTMMTYGLTLPLVGFGASVLKASGEFEKAMNNVQALSGTTGGKLDALRQQAKDLGSTTIFSAGQAAEAMGFLAKAGLGAEQILGTLPPTLNLAAAASMDLGETADILAKTMAGYELPVGQAARATDVLTKAFTSATTDLKELGEAMSYGGGVAAGFGIEFEEAVAVLAKFAKVGASGTRGGTALKNMLSKLSNQSGETQKALKRLGVSVKDAGGNIKPLVDIVRDLGKAGAGTGDALLIFGQRAGPAMGSLIAQGADSLQELITDLKTAGGTAEHIANVQMQGFYGALKGLQSAFEGLQIAIGESGLLDFFTGLTQKITGFIRMMKDSSPEAKKMAIGIAAIALAVGPATLALGALAGALGAIMGPAGAVITVFAALSYVVYEYRDTVKSALKPTLDWIANAFKNTAESMYRLRAWMQETGAKMHEFWGFAPDAIAIAVTGMDREFHQLQAKLKRYQAVIDRQFADMIADMEISGDEISGAAKDVFGDLVTKFNEFLAKLNSLKGGGVAEFDADLESLIKALNQMGGSMDTAGDKGVGAFNAMGDAAKEATRSMTSDFQQFFEGTINGFNLLTRAAARFFAALGEKLITSGVEGIATAGGGGSPIPVVGAPGGTSGGANPYLPPPVGMPGDKALGGAGPPVNVIINVNAIDAQSGIEFLGKNKEVVKGIIIEAWNQKGYRTPMG